jgi:hypothetical protein
VLIIIRHIPNISIKIEANTGQYGRYLRVSRGRANAPSIFFYLSVV